MLIKKKAFGGLTLCFENIKTLVLVKSNLRNIAGRGEIPWDLLLSSVFHTLLQYYTFQECVVMREE